MEFVIGIVLFVLVIVIWAAMSDASAKKYLNNVVSSMHEYQIENCDFRGGSLYCVMNSNVFLSIDEIKKRAHILKNGEWKKEHVQLQDFCPSRTYVALADEMEFKAVSKGIVSKLFTFQPINEVKEYGGFSIDEENNKICLFNIDKNVISHKIIGYKDILACEIVEDGVTVTRSARGSQVGGALVGGLLLGGAGAVIGGLSGKKTTSEEIESISFRITVNDLNRPIYEYKLNFVPIKKNEKYRKMLQDKANPTFAFNFVTY